MPVILPPSAYTVWLDPATRDAKPVQALLTPYPADAMIAYPVVTRVNNPGHDAPECIASLAWLPPLEALLDVLEQTGVVWKADVREETPRLREKPAEAR